MNSNCPICKRKSKLFSRLSRSDKKIELCSCVSCDFIFSEKDMGKSLMNNKLDESRLKNAGMEIPSIKEDYNNGSFQSKNYYNEFINKDENNIVIGSFKKPLTHAGICNARYYSKPLNLKQIKELYSNKESPCK